MEAAAWLRALSFYAYPLERKFAGEVRCRPLSVAISFALHHQTLPKDGPQLMDCAERTYSLPRLSLEEGPCHCTFVTLPLLTSPPPLPSPFMPQIHRLMIAEEELKALKAAALNMALDSPNSNERSACLAAMCEAADLGPSQNDEPKLVLEDGGIKRVLVGSLDLYAVRAMPGEVLIGASTNAAYLANVCTAPAARRRGVGRVLVRAAREQARRWGVEDLYVHTMAVNEAALRFYEGLGFVIEKEESSNSAHHRGRCLDGIEGRGRTVLLKDMQL